LANLEGNLILKSRIFQEKDLNYLGKSQISIFLQVSDILKADLKSVTEMYYLTFLVEKSTFSTLVCHRQNHMWTSY